MSDVVSDPASTFVSDNGQPLANFNDKYLTNAGKPRTWWVFGTRDGVVIKVVYQPAGRGVITAFPVNAVPDVPAAVVAGGSQAGHEH